MTETLTTALEKAATPKETKTVLDLIERMKPEIERSLQTGAGAEILVRHYYSALRYNPLLLQCTGESIVAALLLSAQVRLEPGPLGHVYLVPYKNKGTYEVVWIIGYTGIIELGRRGGAVGLRATIVWDCDEYTAPWENEKGLHWTLKGGPVEDRGERVGVHVTWKEGSERQAIFVPPSRIERARKASAAYKSRSGPWFTDEDTMWCKTGVRAARPFLPLSADLAQAATADGGIARDVDVVQFAAQPIIDQPADALDVTEPDA